MDRCEVYDSVARVLLPRGYDVRYSPEKKKSVLMSAVAHERADVGFLIDDETNCMESVIFGEEEVNDNKLITILNAAGYCAERQDEGILMR